MIGPRSIYGFMEETIADGAKSRIPIKQESFSDFYDYQYGGTLSGRTY